MLMDAAKSLLLFIDLQERLMPAMHERERVLEQNVWLAKVARQIGVPMAATVQYPKGLGATVPELAELLAADRIDAEDRILEKIHFSALAEGVLAKLPEFSRPQIVLTGVETHVCVLQTALDLLSFGKEVFVVAEAVGSRRPEDRTMGLERLRQEGCRIVTREMVAFEWLRKGGTELFRQVSREFVR